MALIKRGDTYWLDVTIRGGRIRKSLGTTDKREATTRAKAMERALWEGTVLGKEDTSAPAVTLESAFDDLYLLHWSETKDAAGVTGRFNTLCRFIPGDTPITAINRQVVDQLVKDMKLAYYTRSDAADAKRYPYSRSTINRVLALLGFILNQMVDKGVIEYAPRMPKTQEEQRNRFLSDEEEDKLFTALADHSNPSWVRCLGLFEFLTDTGCRLGEALKLTWRDCDLDHKLVFLRDTKSGKDKSRPLTDRAHHVLSVSRSEGLPGPFSGLSESVIRAAWAHAKKEAGLGDDKTLVRHSLRHTTASRLIQRGQDVTVVQDFLGHESPLTTRRYIHLKTQHLKAASTVLEGVSSRVRVVQKRAPEG